MKNSASSAELSKQLGRFFDPLGLMPIDLTQMNNFFDPFDLLRSQLDQGVTRALDPFGINRSYLDVQRAWLQDPQKLFDRLMQLSADSWALQFYSWERLSGVKLEGQVPVIPFDERFQDPLWTDVPYLDVLKEYYLLFTRWLEDNIYDTPELDTKIKNKAAFWVRQGLNAMAPSNYFWTNPIAVQRSIETGGQSILDGLKNMLDDVQYKTIRMVDTSAFEVGKNLATTEGEVVYRSDLFELIQYRPTTETVHATPLLFVPPWINKYYIVDLNEKKSMVRWLVNQGYTLFMISWKNPTAEMRNTSLEDYMFKGALEAIGIVKEICGRQQVHAIGYCIGGIILTALMAWINADQESAENSPIAHWSLFTSLADFSSPGEIDVFLDEETLEYLGDKMAKRGYLEGRTMADSFRMLRSNSLIWHYYVHNYLYGEELPKFDVLYWNMDSTRLPEAMHGYYLRELYINNKLVKPGALTLGGRALDLGKITQPLYDVSTEQDHIAPWKQTFKKCALLGGPVRHVLATSGHILGIISPPVEPPKRRYWVGDATGWSDPDKWVEAQEKVPGSWWVDWDSWLSRHCGERVAPPSTGNDDYPPLAPAPGTYVMET